MSRHYCNLCDKRRFDKFMKLSKVDNKIYCNNFILEIEKINCYELHLKHSLSDCLNILSHIITEMNRTNNSVEKICLSFLVDNFTEVELSTRKDIDKSIIISKFKIV